LGLAVGDLSEFLDKYLEQNKRKLTIISTFREPLDRLISSFFQWHGVGAVRTGEVENESKTIIYNMTVEQLQKTFVDEYCENTEIGTHESIELICEESGLGLDELEFDEDINYGLFEAKNFKLILFRFDTLVQHFSYLLTTVTDCEIEIHERNMSHSKWYKEICSEFKETLSIPPEAISRIYNPRKSLINIFYRCGFNSLVSRSLEKYSSKL